MKGIQQNIFLQVQECRSEGSEFLIIGKQVKDLYCLATVIGCVRWLSTVFRDGKEACRKKPKVRRPACKSCQGGHGVWLFDSKSFLSLKGRYLLRV